MKKIVFVILTCFLSPVRAVTMELKYDELPTLVREKNQAVQASTTSVEAAQERTGSLTRAFLPKVEASAGVEHFKTGGFAADTEPYGGVEATLNLFRGGLDSLEEMTRLGQLKVAESDKEKLFREELSAVRNLYWELVYHIEYLKVLDELQQLNARTRRSAKLRFERKLTTNTDVMAFDLFGQQVKEQISSAEHEIKLLNLNIRPRLGLEEAVDLKTPSAIPHDHDEALLDAHSDPSTNPEVQGFSALAEIRESAAKQSARWWMPSVDIYGAYLLYTLRDRAFPNSSDRWDWAAGARLRIHLFDGLQSQRDSASASRQAQAYQQRAAYRRTIQSTETTLAQEEMKLIHELIHGAEEYVKQGNKLMNQYLAEYDRGLRTSPDVLSGIDRVLALNKLNLERRRDYQKAKVKLLGLLGR